MKKTLIFLIITTLVLLGAGCKETKQTTPEFKWVNLESQWLDWVSFQVPYGWNAFYNGDPATVDDYENLWGKEITIGSVSVPDRPISYSDMNWYQVDFAITESNVITEEFVKKQKESDEWQSFEPVEVNGYSGYVGIFPLDNDQVSKAGTGGKIYFLTVENQWGTANLIIKKQALGSDEFEQGFEKILETLQIIDSYENLP